jgi:DNA-directed RNA polymerase specialized sigma24 family protein
MSRREQDPTDRREFLKFCQARTSTRFRVAYGFTADQQLAEDLLQTALERTARRWARIGDPEAYVRRVMYHEFVSWWRRAAIVRIRCSITRLHRGPR